ncbi:hypothetical protein SD70_02560 [Gordoniibacillus kamchatkensis]|uniref:LysM domain-containing protein n=1 Tax=Gordoniibacillus kamchatkensis TaxID=1590651 RepID=A0ABR5ANI4_9BACL|nr:LysM peptidoglycan-binding domain-containing protein [Paenibacillus sp. VKM B-2647]KIL42085.1 hypothetical protein SD70_02560 [Paenibacillus sp. VKM B-2647]
MPNQYDPPRTQFNRNLTIRLLKKGTLVDSFTFPIKPGEFQSDHPARMSTTQTLQGAYQDFGGLGVQKLTYQGHTGWRRRAPNAPNDGFEVFQALYNQTYKQYHKLMQEADDPSQVSCLVIDDLYDTVYEVSLDDFQAIKSRSTPLLYHYILHMTVINTQQKARDPKDYLGLQVQINDQMITADTINQALQSLIQYGGTAPRTYLVQRDDSLQSIAKSYGVDPLKIVQANGLQPPYIFNPGIVLNIPY